MSGPDWIECPRCGEVNMEHEIHSCTPKYSPAGGQQDDDDLNNLVLWLRAGGKFPFEHAPEETDCVRCRLADAIDRLRGEQGKNIDAMVDRFLGWKLPRDFTPDCGISFDGKSEPIGTNLFTATQAKEMIVHMLGAAPESSVPSPVQAADASTREGEEDCKGAPSKGGVQSSFTSAAAVPTRTEGELEAAFMGGVRWLAKLPSVELTDAEIERAAAQWVAYNLSARPSSVEQEPRYIADVVERAMRTEIAKHPTSNEFIRAVLARLASEHPPVMQTSGFSPELGDACPACGNDIYAGGSAYHTNDGWRCGDCTVKETMTAKRPLSTDSLPSEGA